MLQNKGGRWGKGLICRALAHSGNGDGKDGDGGNNDSNSNSGGGDSNSNRKNNNQQKFAAEIAVTTVLPQYFQPLERSDKCPRQRWEYHTLSACWEHHNLSAARWEYDALSAAC